MDVYTKFADWQSARRIHRQLSADQQGEAPLFRLIVSVGLLITALRSRHSLDTGPYGEVARAKEAWREALLERGILPFLREALADPSTVPTLHRPAPPGSTSRIPHLGYHRPGFSSPDDSTPRPSYTSPDYTSPDYGGPEHQPE